MKKIYKRIGAPLLVAAGLMASASAAMACEAEEMQTTEFGFIYKIVSGSNKIEAYDSPDGGEVIFTLELMRPYFVICEAGEYFRITDLPAETVAEAEAGLTGYVLKDQVFNWPTREALNFSPFLYGEDRVEVRAWEDVETLAGFMETGDLARFPPTFQEDLESTLKRERATRPYPVISSEVRTVRDRPKRVFEALIPAAIPGGGVVLEGGDNVVGDVEEVLGSTTFAVVFDATASMEDIARDIARDLGEAFGAIPGQIKESTRIGFVFFRDDSDREKVAIIEPLPLDVAVEALMDASALMSGGGDPAEPILDATYIAAHLFPWDAQNVGRRVVIGVLNADAKPTTTGGIHERVPAGRTAAEIANDLRSEGIQMITMQAGPEAGEYLTSVLTTLAEGSGQGDNRGVYIPWSDADRVRSVTAALTAAMSGVAVRESETAADIGGAMFDYNGFPTIPLDVLDGEQLERLRRAGIEYNITNDEGGVLVTKGYLLENDDLLEPLVEVDKETLESLISLLGVLSVTGVTVEDMIETAGEALASIAGEDYDRDALISELIQKQLGIQFRTGLLAFRIDELEGLNRTERIAMAGRMQDAQERLTNFLEAHLDEFDTQIAVWMPVTQLP